MVSLLISSAGGLQNLPLVIASFGLRFHLAHVMFSMNFLLPLGEMDGYLVLLNNNNNNSNNNNNKNNNNNNININTNNTNNINNKHHTTNNKHQTKSSKSTNTKNTTTLFRMSLFVGFFPVLFGWKLIFVFFVQETTSVAERVQFFHSRLGSWGILGKGIYLGNL